MDVIWAPFRSFLSFPTQLLGHVTQLANEVEPLADAHIVQEIRFHAFAEGISAHFFASFLDKAPEVKHGQEV